ncbi:hypothetical protein LCGC14_1655590 [marine sediment metagenome]|uniref:Uncharacterized protein n=1 Tax=marine sediment metagenome TaxID=412755 RepID=A0A0F9HVK1_9ZZZZ
MAKRRKRRRASGGRTTYKTKAAAKRGKPKRVSVYKVKGGWRRSKRRKK